MKKIKKFDVLKMKIITYYMKKKNEKNRVMRNVEKTSTLEEEEYDKI